MTIFARGPILALCGAACLVALPPLGRPPAEVVVFGGALDGGEARLSWAWAPPPAPAQPPDAAQRPDPADRAAPAPPAASLAVASAAVPADAGLSDAEIAAQVAHADVFAGAHPAEAPVAASAISGAAAPAGAAPVSPAMPEIPARGSEAALLYNRGDVAGLLAFAKAASEPAEQLALEWAALRADSHATFASLAAFLKAHPDWTGREWIRNRQEEQLFLHPETPQKVAAFFAGEPPRSVNGKIAAARAAVALGRGEEAAQAIRALWRESVLDSFAESVILREFGASLAKSDHKYRADRMFYAGYIGAEMRAAALAGPDVFALAQARELAARAPLNPALLRAVPPALRNDPSLAFARIQYARRANRVFEAAVLLNLAPLDRASVINPDRWWSERRMVARELLDLDEPKLAFEVCDRIAPPDSREAQVDAAFHAGWIALRFLHDPSAAAGRFARAADAAETPLSEARAAYWRGRAAEDAGDASGAKLFYERAANEPIAYYGQLAAKRLGLTRLALRASRPAVEKERRDAAIGAVEALYADELDDLATSLAFEAAKEWSDEAQLAAMAEVVKRFGDAAAQVQFGKIAVLRGLRFDDLAFPNEGVPSYVPLNHSADLATVYAVARQESEFIWRAASGAGAKGLMQMLPSTAALTARHAGLDFDYARLLVDPAFNTKLGAALLGQLIEDEGGSRELAFAAYNAGPGRVQQWIAAYGDPRNGQADLVDWIERIPFDETRDYVERVSENLGIYRQRFAEEPPQRPPLSPRLARE